MSKIWWFILIILVLAGITLPLGRVLWPDNPMMPQPGPELLPYYIFLAILESLLFGAGIAFLIFGIPLLSRVPQKYRTRAIFSFVSIVWLMISWWPHDNIHRMNGMNYVGLLYIEYGFHLTLMLASVILAYSLYSFLADSRAG